MDSGKEAVGRRGVVHNKVSFGGRKPRKKVWGNELPQGWDLLLEKRGERGLWLVDHSEGTDEKSEGIGEDSKVKKLLGGQEENRQCRGKEKRGEYKAVIGQEGSREKRGAGGEKGM